MAYGRPSDASLEDWYEAAKTVDQNQAANEAFKLAYRTPMSAPQSVSNPVHPTPQSVFRIPPSIAPSNPAPGNPVPMDIDMNWKKISAIVNCYKCGGPGHKASDFPLRFDIRHWTMEELEMELMARRDLVETEAKLGENSMPAEDFVQDSE